MNFDAIPAELRARRQWVVWRLVKRDDGKGTKVPYRADGSGKASSTDPSTWSTFDAAVAGAEALNANGIGYVFSPDDPYFGLDLDGELSEVERMAIINHLGTYTEASVSGNGYHVIGRGKLANGRHPVGFGAFDRGRYFVMTGLHVRGTPTTIEDRQAELDAVLKQFLPKPAPNLSTAVERSAVSLEPRMSLRSDSSPGLDDRELLDRATSAHNGQKFRDLWEGRWEGRYPSQSEADQALCSLLAFWTGDDVNRIDSLFRQSGLYRDKWERPDYRETTIGPVLGGETYKPPSHALTRNVGPTVKPHKHSYFETRGVPTDIPGKCDLPAVVEAFQDLFVMPDPGAVELALSGCVANYASGDAVDLLFVGAPGCGKSEVVNALKGAPHVWPLSSLTPQTLVSGFESKRKNAPPASLLLQIGPFGILTFKDLTTVLTMHREARAAIIGQLREVADGRIDKSFGNGLRIEWEGKVGMVAGVTPIIDEQHAFLAVMGERFVLYRMPEVSRTEIARRSLARRGREAEQRERIVALVATFLSQFRDVGYLELPERFTDPLIALADIVTRARSGVARDYQSRDILYLPEPEAPTRFAKQIAQLMAAAIKIGVPEERAWRLARKTAWDSVPAVRSAVIHMLSRAEGMSLSYAELEERTGLPSTTVRRVVEDLVVLGLADRRKEGDAANARWLISESGLARYYWDAAT